MYSIDLFVGGESHDALLLDTSLLIIGSPKVQAVRVCNLLSSQLTAESALPYPTLDWGISANNSAVSLCCEK